VLVANRAGAIVYASPSVKHVLGYEPEELLDDGWWRLTRNDSDMARQEREAIAACARGDRPTPELYENRLRMKDGTHRWILWRDSRSVSSDLVIGVGTDITERKLAELELRRSRDELSEQTLRLTNVNKELDAFAYSVSHDLKSPLRLITSYAELLKEDAAGYLNEQSLRFIDSICRNCDQMSNLIGDLLEFSRTSRTDMLREQVDLSRIADQICEILRMEQPERSIHFQIEVGLNGDADQSMMRVLLENLLRNAVKFTATRKVARIEFGGREEQGGWTYYVKDNGVGFEPELADRLFLPFSRLHSGEQFAGTGLGLSIVRRIVERHGGRVWGKGEVDDGATFYFTLD
jgi:PAS domain S-box-containing protein